ncbi:MSMEG_0570 family nitrogen starvation response protein [Gordonia sp. TBRC 11910]|uniref:MSMEG_0570 family nitrogen starvation response protein n=1 Tax=Gordonia asplenii TaxID=2725283 RepID=A0A848L0H9_9ACTN|nr:MSMEG_0570 family nitrogen starvation response protein [Gordonia asplenii]NMO02575.1 MSMEG_0570 family nitrogen starvation response protein [Gordonia asplenii]
MPEMTFSVRWPDGQVRQYYSPSLVMHDFLTAGASYTVEDFTARSTKALAQATERVREKFGFACTSAAAAADDIVDAARTYGPTSTVEVLDLRPPLSSAR